MNVTWKVIVGGLAGLGAIWVLLQIWVALFLPDCRLTANAEALSPNGQYYAVFEQRSCDDKNQSRSSVLMGKAASEEKIVRLEIKGTTKVSLTWNSNSELLVSYPDVVSVKRYGPYDNWPRITEQRMVSTQ